MLSRLINALLPATCLFCRAPTIDARVCRECLSLNPVIDVCCNLCGASLTPPQPADMICADCQRLPPIIEKIRAPYRFAFPVNAALRKLKFQRQLSFAPAFAELMVDTVTTEFGQCDALVPVPLHWWRHATRGYNQADEIAKTLSGLTGLALSTRAVRSRPTAPQTGLPASVRRRNVDGAFKVRHPLPFRHPLIVDDVITTGNTCTALARALIDAGAKAVSAVAVARS